MLSTQVHGDQKLLPTNCWLGWTEICSPCPLRVTKMTRTHECALALCQQVVSSPNQSETPELLTCPYSVGLPRGHDWSLLVGQREESCSNFTCFVDKPTLESEVYPCAGCANGCSVCLVRTLVSSLVDLPSAHLAPLSQHRTRSEIFEYRIYLHSAHTFSPKVSPPKLRCVS